MTFQIKALDAEPFAGIFAMTDAELATVGARREVAQSKPGYPCRVSLRDAEVGEEVILLNHEHQAAATPYRARHAIFVRRGAERQDPAAGVVPEPLAIRLLSVRSFDAEHMMRRGDVVEGAALAGHLEEAFADAKVAYVHIHFAGRGCYAAQAVRA